MAGASSSCGRGITWTLTTSPSLAAAAAPASVAAFTAATSPRTKAVTMPEPTAITLTSDEAGVVVTVELVAADTLLRRGACTYQLWFYDSAGDGVVVASGKLTILPAAPQT